MSRRRKSEEAPISLFSFQDLITCLSGILILVVLLMAIQPVGPIAQDASPETRIDLTDTINRLREAVDSAKNEVARLREVLKEQSPEDPVTALARAIEAEKEQAELTNKVASADRESSGLQDQIEKQRKKCDAAERDLLSLQKETEELRSALAARTDDIFFIPEGGIDKTPILVECSGTAVRVGFIGRNVPPAVFSTDRRELDKFVKHVKKFSTEREYFVFMIKPSGAAHYFPFFNEARRLGFDVGYDALEEERSVGFVRGSS